jgi:hypothetical protein
VAKKRMGDENTGGENMGDENLIHSKLTGKQAQAWPKLCGEVWLGRRHLAGRVSARQGNIT